MVVGIVVDGIVVVGGCGVDVDCFMVDVEVEVDGTTVDMRGVGDSTVDVDGCVVDVGIGLTEVVGVVVGCCWFCGVGLSVVVGVVLTGLLGTLVVVVVPADTVVGATVVVET